MRKPLIVLAVVCVAAGFYCSAQAGDLEPPGPPAPTMVTLQEISDKLDGLTLLLGMTPCPGVEACVYSSVCDGSSLLRPSC